MKNRPPFRPENTIFLHWSENKRARRVVGIGIHFFPNDAQHTDQLMNFEKLVFKKIELWIVLLVIVCGAIFAAAIIAGSYYVGANGERLGRAGNILGAIARAQINVASKILPSNNPLISDKAEVELTAQKTAEGYYVIHQGNTFWPNEYLKMENVPGNWSAKPLMWKSDTAKFPSPLVIQARLNDDGEEALLLFNTRREFIDLIPIPQKSYSGLYDPLIGNLPHVIAGSTDLINYPQGGDGLFRTDICGKTEWSLPGLYNHHYSIADGVLGILGLPQKNITDDDRENWNHSEIINLIDVTNGKLLKSFSQD